MRKSVRKAFTLVEILIVVVILGILAAIVVPQFTNATQDAQAGNIMTQLETLQNQFELYRARNNQYPDTTSATLWDDLVTGGYIKASPVNPYTQSSTVVAEGSQGDTDGWTWDGSNLGAVHFDETTGKIDQDNP